MNLEEKLATHKFKKSPLIVMGQEDIFGDYQPKRTPDTVFDYGVSSGSELDNVLKILKIKRTQFFPIIELDQLKQALQLFKTYKPKAKKNPGKYKRGNMILGAPPEEYIPSEEELIVSEIGKMIRNLLLNVSKEKLENYKLKNKISSQQLICDEIYFTHADVMGSGRFFYAEKIKEPLNINL